MEGNRIDWRKLGNRIADMRIARGITQQWLAEKTGLSETYIGYLEQGKRHGTLDTYLQIVEELGYSLNDLIADDLQTDLTATLAWELSKAMASCKNNEQESILRIIRDVTNIIQLFSSR